MMCAAAALAMSLAGPADAGPPPGSRVPPAVRAQASAGSAIPAAGVPAVTGRAPHSPDRPRARSGDAAIREEFDAARRAGTREAYDLFVARHPDHPLAATAQAERERLR